MQRALAQVTTSTPPQDSSPADALRIHEIIREELAAREAEQTPVTDTVTEVITATLARDLPALVRQLVEGLALEALGLPVTDTNGDVTDTEEYEEATPRQPAQRKRGEMAQKRGALRQPILDLLEEHPEGLSAEEIRVYLRPEKPLGDTLQGMRRQGKVHTRGKGKDMRYFVA